MSFCLLCLRLVCFPLGPSEVGPGGGRVWLSLWACGFFFPVSWAAWNVQVTRMGANIISPSLGPMARLDLLVWPSPWTRRQVQGSRLAGAGPESYEVSGFVLFGLSLLGAQSC